MNKKPFVFDKKREKKRLRKKKGFSNKNIQNY